MDNTKKICKWCCAKLNNEEFNPGLVATTMDCQTCSSCGNNCVSGTFMTFCKIN